MLILSRKAEESIIINDDIEIKIVNIEDNKVKVGIKAPKDVKIYRSEVYEEILKENKSATEMKDRFADLKDFISNKTIKIKFLIKIKRYANVCRYIS